MVIDLAFSLFRKRSWSPWIRGKFVMSMSTAGCSYEKTSIDDDEGFSLLPNDSVIGQRRANFRSRLSYWLWVLAHLVFFISYALLIFLYLNERGQMRCLLGQEDIYDDPPIKYETVVFQQTGFHDVAHNHRTAYEGRPDAKNNNVWDNLMSGKIQFQSKILMRSDRSC